MPARKIIVSDKMQKHYAYTRIAPPGAEFDINFFPELTPAQMLALGVFGGIYLRDCAKEFPPAWFAKAKFAASNCYDEQINYFKVKASQSLAEWTRKGWIIKAHDPRGWFQWYCRYYSGRRLHTYDQFQIKRWRNMKRHLMQIKKNCPPRDLNCRRKQRQALLHWAYDARLI